jgi:hypothetical protein
VVWERRVCIWIEESMWNGTEGWKKWVTEGRLRNLRVPICFLVWRTIYVVIEDEESMFDCNDYINIVAPPRPLTRPAQYESINLIYMQIVFIDSSFVVSEPVEPMIGRQ